MQKPFILITGASRGIGRAIACRLAQKHYSLVLVSSKSPMELQNLKEQLTSYGTGCLVFTCDVADYNQLAALKQTLSEQDIFIEGIINNAGISYFGLIQDMSPADWHRLMDTNLSSVFYTTRLFVGDMLKHQRGCILNISSVFGTTGASCEVAYSASKGAVNAFTKALAKELAPSKIRVNAIACGAIDTVMNSRLTEEEKNSLTETIPAGRMGTPEEVADLACQLYETNDYLTGQVITLDGGWT